MFTGWIVNLLAGIITVNQILTAGIAITAFSLFLYALSFNLRDRVAQAFAVILVCVMVVFTAEALESSSDNNEAIDFFLRLEWIGIIFLPAAYLHLSDGLLVVSGKPSGVWRRMLVYIAYLISGLFLFLLGFGMLLGPLVLSGQPAPHLQRTMWTEVFTGFYILSMAVAWSNFSRAHNRILTRSGRRRMLYLLAGATAPALGSFPYLLYGSSLASQHPLVFWGLATTSNLFIGGLVVVMAYAVAFFGVSWPDRVIKTRLVKWIMRGPVTASFALGAMTIVRRIGEYFGLVYSGAVPTTMVVVVLLMEHAITLLAPLWERLVFYGGDRTDLSLLQSLRDRLITQGDLRQFLEGVLAAIRDHLQSPSAFIAALDNDGPTLIVATGNPLLPKEIDLSDAIEAVDRNGNNEYIWGQYWIFPLQQQPETEDGTPVLLGILGVLRQPEQILFKDQHQVLALLNSRATQALQDRLLQRRVFRSLEALEPEANLIQRWRAYGHYDSNSGILSENSPPESDLVDMVRDALTHYWGGPKLSHSPLMQLEIVQQAFRDNQDTPVNALRAILRLAVDNVRPEGERRFTGEWILYNILEMKFIEGRKVRDVATRLAMSEADLYRKQRVAIEEVARIISNLEKKIKNKEMEQANG